MREPTFTTKGDTSIIEVIAVAELRPDLLRIYLGEKELEAINNYFNEQMELRSPATAEICKEIVHDLEALREGHFKTAPFVPYFMAKVYRKAYRNNKGIPY